jgi:hypothetical protein
VWINPGLRDRRTCVRRMIWSVAQPSLIHFGLDLL